MSKRDVLDEELLHRFAWRTAADIGSVLEPRPSPGELRPSPRRDTPPPPPPPFEAKAADDCDALAREVLRVWAMPADADQAAATRSLMQRAERIGIFLPKMEAHPLEGARLLRLAARHRGPPEGRNVTDANLFVLEFLSVPFDEPELGDLLVETARVADVRLVHLVDHFATEEVGRRHPDLGARLGQVLDDATTWTAREAAARWLGLVECRDAEAALRRAIRMPHLRLRTSALRALLQRRPAAITEDDAQWLLEDAVGHPLIDRAGVRPFDLHHYEKALVDVVTLRRPPEGWHPLATIADGRGARVRRRRDGLDRDWALRALSAGYPDRALGRIDAALASPYPYARRGAIEATASLAEALARPRLLEAASLPDRYHPELAKKLWFDRFGEACPVDELAGVPRHLLEGPPSDALVARLAVIRSGTPEAVRTILAAALTEAPSREALALILYSLRQAQDGHDGDGLPENEEAWAGKLVELFGEPAFEGLLAMAMREVRAGVELGWLDPLRIAAKQGMLDDRARARLHDEVVAALGDPTSLAVDAPIRALWVLGVPATLIDRLWELMLAPGHDPMSVWRSVIEAFGTMGPGAPIDARVVAEADAALRARDFPRLDRLVALGAKRELEGMLPLAARCLDELGDDPAAIDVGRACVFELSRAKRLTDAWLVEALSNPETLRFSVTTTVVQWHGSPAVAEVLGRALGSGARGGRAAAEAASALLRMEALSPDDPRLEGILARAPDAERDDLVGAMGLRKAPFAVLEPWYVGLIASRSPQVAMSAYTDAVRVGRERVPEVLAAALALEPTAEVRADIERRLKLPSEAELYWLDEEDEEQEGDEERVDDDDWLNDDGGIDDGGVDDGGGDDGGGEGAGEAGFDLESFFWKKGGSSAN